MDIKKLKEALKAGKVKIAFAPRTEIERFNDVADHFMRGIFKLKPEEYAISDESSISDFVPVAEAMEPVLQQIIHTYKIGIVPNNLLELFQLLRGNLLNAKTKYPPMWTVYTRPLDYPEHIVVRLWYGEIPDFNAELFDDLQEARQYVMHQGGCFNLQRAEEDSPFIVETWI